MDLAMRQALENKDYEKVQDRWTDMVLDTTITIAAFFEVTDALHQQGATELAASLLDMLAAHYDTERLYDRAIEVCRHLFLYRKEDSTLRQYLIELYRKQYLHCEHLNKYLELSGVSTNEPIMKSLARLDEFLAYDVGNYFYFERYGIGQVIEVNPDKKEIVLDFERKKRHFLTLSVARGLLLPLDRSHFLYLRHTDTNALKALAEQKPVDAVIKLLKSWQQPLNATQIKKHFHDIIDDSKISRFWEGVRKQLEKHPHVEVHGRTNKTYAYVESDKDRTEQARMDFINARPRDKYALAQEYVRTMPELLNEISQDLVALGNRIHAKDPALAIAILLFCREHSIEGNFAYDLPGIIGEYEAPALLKKIPDPEHQKKVLQTIKDMNPGTWTKLYKQIMLAVNQPKVLDEISVCLQEQPNVLKDTFYTILSIPKNYPHGYQWMLKKMIDGALPDYLKPTFLPRIIESLDHVSGVRSLVKKLLSLENFDGLIKQALPDEAQRILEVINMNETLEEYQKNDYIRIIQYHHPNLFAQTEEVVYTTDHALKRRRAEFEHLLREEIPANKKEISRAREFGDLSENFEYKAAREKQAQLLEKARIMEQELSRVKVIDPSLITTDTVSIGTRVLLVDKNGRLRHFTILGRWDTDLENNILSNEAPAAQKLLGKKAGDTVTLNETDFTIKGIEKAL